jgi:uncharacterized protein YukE
MAEGEGFSAEFGALRTLAVTTGEAERAFEVVQTTVRDAGIGPSAWPKFTMETDDGPSAQALYDTTHSVMAAACADFMGLFAEVAKGLRAVLSEYHAAEGSSTLGGSALHVPSTIGVATSAMSGSNDLYQVVAGAGAASMVFDSAAMGVFAFKLPGPETVLSTLQKWLDFAKIFGLPGSITYLYFVDVIPNVRDPGVFTDAARTWTQVAGLASEVGAKLADCFPLTGWQGKAAETFTSFMRTTVQSAIADFSRMAMAIAAQLNQIASMLNNFLHGVLAATIVNIGLLAAILIGLYVSLSISLGLIGNPMLLAYYRRLSWVIIGVWAMEATALIGLAIKGASTVAGTFRTHVLKDADALRRDISGSVTSISGDRLHTKFQQVYVSPEHWLRGWNLDSPASKART